MSLRPIGNDLICQRKASHIHGIPLSCVQRQNKRCGIYQTVVYIYTTYACDMCLVLVHVFRSLCSILVLVTCNENTRTINLVGQTLSVTSTISCSGDCACRKHV